MTHQPTNLATIADDFFRQLVHRCVMETYAYYRERLVAIYVTGSVHRNEAIAGISDLDTCTFITDRFDAADRQWRDQINDRLAQEFAGPGWGWIGAAIPVSALDPPAHEGNREPIHRLQEAALRGILEGTKPEPSVQALLRRRACAYMLRYDATLVGGHDVAGRLDVAPVDGLWAQVSFQSPWDLIRHTAGLAPARLTAYTQANLTEFPLPQEPALRLRKLARLGVLGGAYLLMARGEFRSFRGVDVLPALTRQFPERAAFFAETAGLYLTVPEVGHFNRAVYLSDLADWMDWAGEQISL